MSTMLATIQSQLLQVLKDHRSGSGNTEYPKFLDNYAGQLRKPEQVDGTPAIYVDLPDDFEVSTEDAGFNLLNLSGNPALVLFTENQAGHEDTRTEMADLIDWVIGALKGQTLTVNELPIPIERIRGRVFPEYDENGNMAVAVLTVMLTAFED